MKMNATVARIVEIMFQDVEMNDETAAIRDEVMNNCQERFHDLMSTGMVEDDAIAAVIESLKGMEEVLAPYKKVQPDGDDDLDDDDMDTEKHVIFAANTLHAIDLELVSEDVTIEASDDADYHVIWDTNENPLLKVELHDGVLRVERAPGDAVKMKEDGRMEYHHQDGHADFVRTEKGKIEINFDSIEGMLKDIGETVKRTFSNFRFNVGGNGTINIRVPENAIPHVKLLTSSGDINVQDVALTDLNITTTSGDIDVDLGEDQCLEFIELRTTSGDMEVNTYADRASIASTSGDVEVNGRYGKLSIGTVSGDIEVRADVVNMNFSAISGDVDLQFESDEIRKVSGSTVSGDIEIELPEGLGVMGIGTQTRSGDVTTRYEANGVGPVVTGGVSSMSGDITIR